MWLTAEFLSPLRDGKRLQGIWRKSVVTVDDQQSGVPCENHERRREVLTA